MPRFDVVRMVGPVAPPVELRIVSVAPILSALTAIVYAILGVTLASSVRLLNSFVPPASAANVSVPLAASRIVTVLVPAAHEAEGVGVRVGVALKTPPFVATGGQLHVAPPDVFDQFAPVAQVPPAPIR